MIDVGDGRENLRIPLYQNGICFDKKALLIILNGIAKHKIVKNIKQRLTSKNNLIIIYNDVYWH